MHLAQFRLLSHVNKAECKCIQEALKAAMVSDALLPDGKKV